MTISMYHASIPPIIRSLNNLIGILQKGLDYASAKNIEQTVLLNTRLYPDMFPLTKQVQIASDISCRGAARLAGLEPPVREDNETSFEELIERVKQTIAYLESIKPEQIDGSEEKMIDLPVKDQTFTFEGMPFLLIFVMPNVYFHVTTAYGILRHCGVELGKMDYLGKP
ncbi:DUF1993 family protein [Gloeocapsa sp. PCC 73106]|uniref:DUF1993 domain-containing protein n=1 Tax=Gloeocapsa sp. PCC 73106 TaxID=102232 RepID=UPI0002ACF1F1|nr:DUF1993 domain-containing protein [Gloeocapsa sp. PCC 73106]ELR96334.1 hypothetical protein GLO73106DRAFT_00001240 [Gloeocapsa sp. PCC 73106]